MPSSNPGAPSHEQLGLEGDLGIEPAAPVQPQIAPKNDRLFWALPNYLTVENRDQSGPLSAKTKFELSAKTMSDPVTISFIGAMALIGQARNRDPSYGQGLEGYAKRFGTFYADTGIGTLITTSVFPTLLHQDPRYFQLGKSGAWHRVVYSVSQSSSPARIAAKVNSITPRSWATPSRPGFRTSTIHRIGEH